ncbi:MAG: M43 family zinc metalloprotease [Bacteroidota bacterium]
MPRYLLVLVLLLSSVYIYINGQTEPPICATFPIRLGMDLNAEARYRNAISQPSQQLQGNNIITLPIVFHVIHQNGPENLSDERIIEALEWVNEAFAHQGYYQQGFGVETGIRFCLAKQDPDGNPTTGITRHISPLTNVTFAQDVEMKDIARWDPLRYVNVYICNQLCRDENNCGVAGYAYYPFFHGEPFDGVVMGANYVGSTPGYMTLTHELGHYLGLAHTFDGGCFNDDCTFDGDMVCDTPPDDDTSASFCDSPANSCSTDTDSGNLPSDLPDMVQNFMDYGYWQCRSAFTQGQADRMQFFAFDLRASLFDSNPCEDPCPEAEIEPLNIPDPLLVGQAYTFEGSDLAENYQWILDGNLESQDADWSYIFTEPGCYKLTLAQDRSNEACLDITKTYELEVNCFSPNEIETLLTDPQIDQTDVFTLSNSESDAEYTWTLNGNPIDGTDGSASFTYSIPDLYELCVTLERDACSQTFCREFTVGNTPEATDCNGGSWVQIVGQQEMFRPDGIMQIENGDFIAYGNIGDQAHLFAYTASGNLAWQRALSASEFGSTNPSTIHSIINGPEGDLFLVLSQNNDVSTSGLVISRYDPENDVFVWSQNFNTLRNASDILYVPEQNALFIIDPLSSASNILKIDPATGSVNNDEYLFVSSGSRLQLQKLAWLDGQLYAGGITRATNNITSRRSAIALVDPQTLDIQQIQVGHVDTSQLAIMIFQDLIVHQGSMYMLTTGNDRNGASGNANQSFLTRFEPGGEAAWTREITLPDFVSHRMTHLAVRNNEILLLGHSRLPDQRIILAGVGTNGQLNWSTSITGDEDLYTLSGSSTNALIPVGQNLMINFTFLSVFTELRGRGVGLARLGEFGKIYDQCIGNQDIDIQISPTTQSWISTEYDPFPVPLNESFIELVSEDANLLRTSFCQEECPEECQDQSEENIQLCQGDSLFLFGNYIFEAGTYSDTTLSLAGCDSIHTANVTLLDLPTSDFQIDYNCSGLSALVTITPSGGSPPYTYEWSTPDASGGSPTLAVGTYTYTITDANGCSSSSEVEITELGSNEIELTTIPISCAGEADGGVVIENSSGSVRGISADGINFSETDTLSGLEAGRIPIWIDIAGCVTIFDVEIEEPLPLQLGLPRVVTLDLGDSIRINPTSNRPLEELDFSWSPSTGVFCNDGLDLSICAQPWLKPVRNTTYRLTASASENCSVEASIEVLVDRNVPVYIPTAFSPNDDGVNDRLRPFTSDGINRILSFRVFDRWGNLLHEAKDANPTDNTIGWNGRGPDGRLLTPQVVVYQLQLLLDDGREEIMSGTVTILR